MDQKLLLLINHNWTSPAMDRIMALLSSSGFWMPLLGIACLALAIFGGFRARSFLIMGLLFLAINDSAIANSLKHAIHRLRPWQALDRVRQVDLAKVRPQVLALWMPLRIGYSRHAADRGDGRSLPSAHTINTMTFAMLAALFFRRIGFVAFLAPLLVGYSRIYVGAHWPSDVAISLFLGAGTTLLMATVAETAWRRHGARWLPQLHRQHPSLFAE